MIRVQSLPEKYRDCLKKSKSRGMGYTVTGHILLLRVIAEDSFLAEMMLYIPHLTDISTDFRANLCLEVRLRPHGLRPVLVSTCNSMAHTSASPPWGL